MRGPALALAVLAFAAGCWDGGAKQDPDATTITAHPSLGAQPGTGHASAITLRVPRGWHASGFSTTNSPARMVVATFPVARRDVEGDCGGVAAVRRLPSRGALILLIDYGTSVADPQPPRPRRFRLEDGLFAQYECFGPSYMFRFRIDSRQVQAHIALGSGASRLRKEQALAILSSVTTTRRPRGAP